jgi:SAM-dependent methyltransferase
MHCGLMFLFPRPTIAELKEYYPEDYSSFHRSISFEANPLVRFFRRRNIRHRRIAVERHTGLTQGKLLDIGSSTGIFLDEMRSSGWQVRGLEPSHFAAKYAQEQFNLNISEIAFRDMDIEPETYDVITLWDALEHTQSMTATIQKIMTALKPGGWMIANIPNPDSVDRRLFGPHWLGFDPPRHLYVIPKETLDSTLSKAGFQNIHWRSFLPSYFSFMMSFERWLSVRSPSLAYLIGKTSMIPGVRFIFEPYFALANKFQFSGLATVFAEKPN